MATSKTRKDDPEVIAIRSILRILLPHTPDARKRIIDYAVSRVPSMPVQTDLFSATA